MLQAVVHCDSAEFVQEELTVTFQVVLIGNDGILVGSDRRQAIQTPVPGLSPSYQFDSVFKFTKKADESIICASAGGPMSQTIARGIATNCIPSSDELSWQNSLADATVIAANGEYSNTVDEIIVARRDDYSKAWIVRRTGNSNPQIETVNESRCTGANLQARFVPSHFWRKAAVRELHQLALLTLALAADENKTAVGSGFDIMTISNGDIGWEHYAADDVRIAQTLIRFKQAWNNMLFT